MTINALVCLAHGSEELEAITVVDLLDRANIAVTLASVEADGATLIQCAHGTQLQTDTLLSAIADTPFDVMVLPGGVRGATTLSESALLIEKIRQQQLDKKLIAAICAAPALILEKHHLFPIAIMTGYPSTKSAIAPQKWVDRRVCYDERVNLLTSQGPATAIDFALKIIDLLLGEQQAANVAAQLVLPPGIYNYQAAQ